MFVMEMTAFISDGKHLVQGKSSIYSDSGMIQEEDYAPS